MGVSNFNPLWLEVLRDAGTKEVSLPFPDMPSANSMRQKLYKLRFAMEKENHEWFHLAAKVSMSCIYVLAHGEEISYINNTKTPRPKAPFNVILRLKPQDSKFDEVLALAGYKLEEPPPLD